MSILKKIPNLPKFFDGSPFIVKTLDKIRYQIDKNDSDGELSEFYWFAREYPRIYRYHLDHAQHRLKEIHNKYIHNAKELDKILRKASENSFQIAISNKTIHQVYWDFECYLNSINCALDILARIISPAFNEQTPVSLNKICNKKNLEGPVEILRRAKSRWINRLKDYRDCFIHYTPVDNRVYLNLNKYSDGWEIHAKLPINPNIRNIEGFKFSRRVELLKYSFTVYKHMVALDRAIAKSINKLYLSEEYPKRTKDLFFIGQRTR